jgi:valyl-tRNA synthetase
LSDRLNNPSFVEKAPEALIQKTKQALAEAEKQAQILQERLKRLQ